MYVEQIQIRKDNKIAAMDPIAKLLVVLLYFVTNTVLGSISEPFGGYSPFLYAWFLSVVILAAVTGIMKKFLKAMRVIVTIFVIVLSVQAFIVETGNPDIPGTVLWRWNISDVFHPTVWEYGLQNGLKLGFNILNGAGIFVWLFRCTKNKELSRALEERGMNSKFVFVFLSSMQMIGVLNSKSVTIMNAQRARGVETDGNIFVRAKAFIPIIVPLVLSSVTDIEDRVLAMESKGFNAPCKKTHLLVLHKSGVEKTVTAVFAVLLAVSVIGRVLVWVL